MSTTATAQYLVQLGLEANPFPVTPDASNYFLTKRMEVSLIELLHCIEARKGFMLVTADIGIGKTTLSRRLISILTQQETHVSLIFNSFLNGINLLEAINQDFGLLIEGGIREQLNALNKFLLSQFKQGKNAIIILDDAQNLSMESLELLRQISNLETDQHKLVQILLIAQPEIMVRLSFPEIRQLKSRIVLHIQLPAFNLSELIMYIEFRLASFTSKCQSIGLTKAAFKYLYRVSKGYPRQINLIMDRVLYGLSAQKNTTADVKLMRLAVCDLQGPIAAQKHHINYKLPLIWTLLIIIGWILSQLWFPHFNLDIAKLKIPFYQADASLYLATNNPPGVNKNTPYGLGLAQRKILSTIIPQDINTDTNLSNELKIKTYYFLHYYALESLLKPMLQALAESNFQNIKQRLKKHGWRLILFSKADPTFSNDLQIIGNNGEKKWLRLLKKNS
ncbi:MAG: AAA family ATPase [Pseudomonadota bacterium]